MRAPPPDAKYGGVTTRMGTSPPPQYEICESADK